MIKARYRLYCLIVLLGINMQALSEEEVNVLKAQPTTKFQLLSEESVKTKLNSSESAKNLVWILEKTGNTF